MKSSSMRAGIMTPIYSLRSWDSHPDHNLDVHGGLHGAMMGRMLKESNISCSTFAPMRF
jgi:hypothetical protein